MKHKSIIKLLSAFFSVGILFSISSIFIKFTAKPETIFSFVFIFLIALCIAIFKIADNLEKNHKNNKLINVVNQDLKIL